MKVIIEYGGEKRQIDGDFSICLGKEEANIICNSLREMAISGYYGWVDIRKPLDKLPNTPAQKWVTRDDGDEVSNLLFRLNRAKNEGVMDREAIQDAVLLLLSNK